MVGIDIHDLTVIEHLLVDVVEVRRVGAKQHALSLGKVGTCKIHLHLNIVEHAQGVGSCIVTHWVDH